MKKLEGYKDFEERKKNEKHRWYLLLNYIFKGEKLTFENNFKSVDLEF